MSRTQTRGNLAQWIFEEGVLHRTGVDGLYGRSKAYLATTDAVHRIIHHWGSTFGSDVVSFPPVMSRPTFEMTNYLESFPDLMGSVQVFTGGDAQHAELVRRSARGNDLSDLLTPASVVLCPAACHQLYPMLTGSLPPGGRWMDVRAVCFRHEPSTDPMRQLSFEMHEVVFAGDSVPAEAHRDQGLQWGLSMLESLGLPMEAVPASDPFFGRLGSSLTAEQEEQELKLEGVTPSGETAHPVAIMSANCHRDHFGATFAIECASGEVAHSACVAFGIDRIALALFEQHGPRPSDWPRSTREVLWP
jgi:seryl-tRNA synthetase